MADPGFPVGGRRRLPRQLRFENFVCRNERIWILGGRAPGTPPRSANAVCVCLGYLDACVWCVCIYASMEDFLHKTRKICMHLAVF